MYFCRIAILFSLALNFLFATTNGQTERIYHWPNNLSLVTDCHVVDKSGNIYIVASLEGFDAGEGMAIEGPGFMGKVLYKLDVSGKMVWIQSEIMNSNWEYTPYRKIYLVDDTLVSPYGNGDAFGNNFGPHDGCLKVNTLNGAVIENKDFDESVQGNSFNLLTTAKHKNNTISYVYRQSKSRFDSNDDSICINTRSLSLQDLSTSKAPFYPRLSPIEAVFFDSFADQYIAFIKNGIAVYDSNWQQVRQLTLPGDSTSKYSDIQFACNAGYYVAVFYLTTGQFYTAVWSKAGALISYHQSEECRALCLTADNRLFAAASRWYGDSASQPITLSEMDLYQNIIRQEKIGQPYATANQITVTGDNEIIVTGTEFTSNPQNYPNKSPDGIYYYKNRVDSLKK